MSTTTARRRPESELRTRIARVVYTVPDRALIDALLATVEAYLAEQETPR